MGATVFSPQRSGTVPPGTQLSGIYEIDALLASGGMGEVYRGHAIETGDAVAIKLVRPDFAENEAALSLFRKEAAALNRLHHEAIVRYYVFTIDPTLQRPYMAMELVEGVSLSDLIEQRGALPVDQVFALKNRLASGLQAAHERGIIHRDISPDNIIVPGDDLSHARIIDFGIARSTAVGEKTVIGTGFAGKYNYVSPEQIGLYGGDVKGKSDIYSLGLVLVNALRGKPLDMGGSQVDVVEKRRKVPDLSDCSSRMRPLLKLMLAPDPKDRIATMADVAAFPLGKKKMREERAAAPARVPTGVGAARPAAAAGTTGEKSNGKLLVAAAAVVVLVGMGGFVAWLQPWAATTTTAENQGKPRVSLSETAPPAVTPTPVAPTQSTPVAPASPPSTVTATAEPPVTPSVAPTPPLTTIPATPPTPSGPVIGRLDTPSVAPTPSVVAPTPIPTLPPQVQTPAPPQNTTVAAVPVVPPAAPTRADTLSRYIQTYDGGTCTFVSPVDLAATSPSVEAFAANTNAFNVLDSAFKKANNLEATITPRVVESAQCPALNFLRQLKADPRQSPRITLSKAYIRNGERLEGSIESPAPSVDILIVDSSGFVTNVTDAIRFGATRPSFGMRPGHGDKESTVLLLAISGAPGNSAKTPRPVKADEFFKALGDAPGRQGMAATSRSFTLE